MITKEVVIKNQVGLHARPATFFIQKANEFKSSIWVEKEERRVNAKSLLGVLSLGIVKGTAITIVADGADEARIKEVIAKTVEKFGKINTLINNAQASKSGLSLLEHTKEDFNLAINSGLYATFFYMKEAFPYLKESKGSVINFASGAGLFGKPGQSSYAAAKEGIRGLSRVAATEWGPDGVRVNMVAPLAMTESLQEWKENYPELFAKTIQGIPLGRFADPMQDIGRVCVFLASDDASYVTGETISLQGGSGLRP